MLDYIYNQRIKWFGHLMRMDPNQPAARAYNSHLSGTRPKGRPRRRWHEGVRNILKDHQISMTDATHAAQERCLSIAPRP